jgi:C1A family cysteine protease
LKKNNILKIVAISIFTFLLTSSLTVTSSLLENKEIIDQVHYSDCGINLISDLNLSPCYVMENLTLTYNETFYEKPNTFSSLPSHFNWKSQMGEDYTTSAKNQGSCGSCWAFATVSCFESIINIAWDNPDLDLDLSEQYILSCLSQAGSCSGGYPHTAFKLIQSTSSSGNYHNGLIPEDCMPYRADDTIPCSDKCEDWENKLVQLEDYGYFRPSFPEDIDTIKSAIMTYGPVVTLFYATSDFARWGSAHHNSDEFYPYVEHSGANHAVIIVGWKDDSSIANGGYWIVKNSWGTGWGYDGFFNIEYGSLNIDDVEIDWAQYDANPIASFTHTPKNPQSEESIQFEDQSQVVVGDISSWKWDFDDGTVSNEQNPTHAYESDGSYQVTLTVKDEENHVNAVSKNVYVGDDTPPTTSYTIHGLESNSGWYTGFVTVSLTSFDSFSGVETIWYNLNDKGYKEYTGRINFYNEPDGQQTIDYYAVDNASNKEEEKSVTLNIDWSDPAIRVLKPADNTLYFCNIPLFAFLNRTIIIGFVNSEYEIIDNASGLSKVEFYLDNTLIKTDYAPPFKFIISGRNVGGLSVIKVKAYDQAGRTSKLQQYVTLSSFGLLSFIN